MLHAHPDKTNNPNDENAKRLNDARDRARQMYYSLNCETARIIKDHEDKKRKREVFRIVQRIYKNHYENACYREDGPYFEREMEECPADIRKEAEDIVENGLGDTKKKLAAAEKTITLLKEEIKCYQAKEKADKTHLKAIVEQRKILEKKLNALISEVKEEIDQQVQCLKEITEQIEKEATKESAKLDFLRAEFENLKHQAHFCGTEHMNASQELEVAQQSADISPKYKKRKQDNETENSRLRENEKEKQLATAKAEIYEQNRSFEEREELYKANAVKEIFFLQAELEKLKDDFNTLVSIEHQKETQSQADGPKGNAKKRKRDRVFLSGNNPIQFKQAVTEFIRARLVPSRSIFGFVTTKDIIDKFKEKYPNGNYSDILFFKELRKQISDFGFPGFVTYTQHRKLMGYKGLALH